MWAKEALGETENRSVGGPIPPLGTTSNYLRHKMKTDFAETQM
jgi:hypothetical protein